MSTNLTDYLDDVVYPSLWPSLNLAFPEFGFVIKNGYWQAKNASHTKHLPGSPRPDRVMAYQNTPFGFQIQGGEFITWLFYVNQMRKPTGKDFLEALHKLCQLAAARLPEIDNSPAALKKAQERDRQQEILETFWQFVNQMLFCPDAKHALQYVQKRGLSQDKARRYLGYYPSSAHVKKHLLQSGFTPQEIGFSSHEVLKGDPLGSGLVYDSRWQGRLIGVWRNCAGRIVNFWARDLSANPNATKYLLLKGGSKDWLFGMDALCQRKELTLVEGFLDAIALWPDINAVATGGVSLSDKQIQSLIKTGITSLTLNLDYDGASNGAGHKGTITSLHKLLIAQVPFHVYAIDPSLMAEPDNPQAKVDPDEYLHKHGLKAYHKLLANGLKMSLYLAHHVLVQHDLTTAKGKDASINEVLFYERRLINETDREDLWRLVAQKTGYSLETLLWQRRSQKSLGKDASNTNKDNALDTILRHEKVKIVDTLPPTDTGFIYGLPTVTNATVLDLLRQGVQSAAHFALLAPQGSGKSFAAATVAAERLIAQKSTLFFARSHDELKQFTRLVSGMLKEKQIPLTSVFHLSSGREQEEDMPLYPQRIPQARPLIVAAPHIYLHTKGDTPYHHTIVEMVLNKEFGDDLLIFIDEAPSCIDGLFVCKQLGARYSLKTVYGKRLEILNKLCPLFVHHDNCNNCKGSQHLAARRGHAGMLVYVPLLQRAEADNVQYEQIDCKGLVSWDKKLEDKTMVVYPLLSKSQNFALRKWSTGTKKDVQLEISLAAWLEDQLIRLVSPHLVCHFPYDKDSQKNMQRPLTAQELELRKSGANNIVPPRQVCGVFSLQGWDALVLRGIKDKAQIGFMGPDFSSVQRVFLHDIYGEKLEYLSAGIPYVRLTKVLIVTIESDLPFTSEATQEFVQSLASKYKVLSFLSTRTEAIYAQEEISKKVRTVFYDGAQHTQDNLPEGTSIEFDLFMTFVHGSLGQGLNLFQFQANLVSTNTERPKFLFAGRPRLKEINEQILDDVAETSIQSASRIMREQNVDQAGRPRVIIFYGHNAWEVGERALAKFAKVGHTIKLIHSKKCLGFAEQMALRWLAGEDTQDLEQMGVAAFEEEQVIRKSLQAIQKYTNDHPQADWRELQQSIREVKNLSHEHKERLRLWFEQEFKPQKDNHAQEKLIEKIKLYLTDHPNAVWNDIYQKFHLQRKAEEERERLKTWFTEYTVSGI